MKSEYKSQERLIDAIYPIVNAICDATTEAICDKRESCVQCLVDSAKWTLLRIVDDLTLNDDNIAKHEYCDGNCDVHGNCSKHAVKFVVSQIIK